MHIETRRDQFTSIYETMPSNTDTWREPETGFVNSVIDEPAANGDSPFAASFVLPAGKNASCIDL